MRPSLTTPQGKAKCLHCRKKLAKILFNARVTSRVRCYDCANLVIDFKPEIVNKKGFLVKEVGYQWVTREYTPV